MKTYRESRCWGRYEDKSFKRTQYQPVNNGYRPQKLCMRHDTNKGVFCNDPACNCDHVDTNTYEGYWRMQKVKAASRGAMDTETDRRH